MNGLRIIQQEVAARGEAVRSQRGYWPCCNGCDDCCRSLAWVPMVTQDEWGLIKSAIDQLPTEVAVAVRKRIADSAALVGRRPIVCPLLDMRTGSCLVYEARPVACRAYGFYAEREKVLGCWRIEEIARESDQVVWGNHSALEDRLKRLGEARALYDWLD